jgi:hypothetical protein
MWWTALTTQDFYANKKYKKNKTIIIMKKYGMKK